MAIYCSVRSPVATLRRSATSVSDSAYKLTALSSTLWRRSYSTNLNRLVTNNSRYNVEEERTVPRFSEPKPMSEKRKEFLNKMLEGVLKGERSWLSQAITLVESSVRDHRIQAQNLISQALERHNAKKHIRRGAFRIGLSGPPGAGKSTFIEAFGSLLTDKGYKLAVLAVDPSSTRTGGSILGDKTRMEKLTNNPNAYIRPSPSRCTLGGVARNTTEAIALCEVAGYDIIIVETVGVGQSETTVADMVDLFCLLMPPAAGDELQGIKRGIVEIAQVVLVNKADGDLVPAATRSTAEIRGALKILRPQSHNWKPKVQMLSSLTNTGLDKAWDIMVRFRSKMLETGEWNQRRRQQNQVHMWSYVQANTMELLHADPGVRQILRDLEGRVMRGEVPAGSAADQIVDKFLESRIGESVATPEH
ncbi:hypothetical protein SARC_10525 [Sphaeroforma arctica JP610]|uniref:AAA+ ATPase domain-containing protein n=1 Tax=Sphaeroforma arctica JP610 TaxID=667725 RepID=A0A0L0FJS0_9EUKA|nr:hypothetical protein SARC_10525 [Sphaeroforma arctica JP610]KNC77005.1 hypothetical protein SARC_10525 [Sphaeroforma arctica JP610]|eukprot:XP_014150907.1 hypothetical protein SARC_10525 [Sphaeroforma arctica JP610]